MNDQERVRLRAREGEAVEWTRRVAQRAGTLKDMMDDAPTEDGVYPVPTIAAAELAVLREMCEADSMPARLEQCSISELFRLVEGASFLDAPGALNHAQRALATRLNGKRADELRELLGATDDFGSAENRVAALAEPAFSPEGQLSVAAAGSAAGPPALQPQLTLGYAGGAPALQPQPSLSGMAVTDDAKEVALGMVDVGTLAELKGVNRSWLALARRVLCSRLSRCEGQPAPTQMAEITDLNIKVLVDAGRPWEAAAAGRMLPSLARLRWEGFTVNVAAVREVDLRTPRQEREFLGGRAKAALLSCIEGEGEPPLELLLAAVACAGSGEIRGIPVQMMRDDSVSELDLQDVIQDRNIGVEGGMLLAYLVPVMGALTSIDLSDNQLCGVRIDHRGRVRGTYTAEGIIAIADALRVNGALTSIKLRGNKLGDEGWGAIFAAICGNKDSKIMSMNAFWENIGPAGVKLIAEALRTSVTGALTSVDLRGNKLGDEGWGAIFAAICGNKDSKIMSMDVSGEDIGPAGVKLIAKALRTSVTGALTSVDLGGNELGDEGWGAIFAAICGNKDSKIMSMDASSENIGPAGVKLIAEALRTSVTGALTSVNLGGNELGDKGWGAIFAAICGNKDSKIMSMDVSGEDIGPDGVKLIAEALRTSVTGGLTVTNLLGNQLDAESAKMLADVAKQKGISLCGIQRDQTTADFSNQNLKPPEAILLASDLSQAVVTGALTVTNLLGNQLDAESAKMLAEVAKQKGISLCGIQRDQTTADFSNQNLKPPDAILLESDLSQAVVTGALTSLDLSSNQLCGLEHFGSGTYTAEGITAIANALRVNGALMSVNLRDIQLGDKGWGAIFAAICGNKDSKITSLNTYYENIGPAGVKLITEALRTSVTGGLTVTDLLGNKLDAESAKMLADVAKQKGISLCGIQRDQTTADFSNQNLKPPEAILLASDLSQAVVTGGLTSLNLSDNQLCGLDDCERGTYTAEGITAIADALRVNGGLTKMSLAHNNFGEEGIKAICEALEQNKTLKELDISGNIRGTAEAKHVANMICVNGGLTSIDLSANLLCGTTWTDGNGNQLVTYTAEGITAIADALRVNGGLTSIDLSGTLLCGIWTDWRRDQQGIYTAEGITAIADALRVNGALTSIKLRSNMLGGEGWGAIFAAICGNKDSKIMSMDVSGEDIGPAGVKLIAEALRTSVTGSLTEIK